MKTRNQNGLCAQQTVVLRAEDKLNRLLGRSEARQLANTVALCNPLNLQLMETPKNRLLVQSWTSSAANK